MTETSPFKYNIIPYDAGDTYEIDLSSAWDKVYRPVLSGTFAQSLFIYHIPEFNKQLSTTPNGQATTKLENKYFGDIVVVDNHIFIFAVHSNKIQGNQKDDKIKNKIYKRLVNNQKEFHEFISDNLYFPEICRSIDINQLKYTLILCVDPDEYTERNELTHSFSEELEIQPNQHGDYCKTYIDNKIIINVKETIDLSIYMS